jgi:ATP-dependent Clp protease ATP-binding subunit ClpA
MFERFTDRARRAVVQAQAEAKALEHNYIGPEHLLLGLTHESVGGVGAKTLESLGVWTARVGRRPACWTCTSAVRGIRPSDGDAQAEYR